MKELLCGAAVETAIFDVGPSGERLHVFDRRREPLGGEEGRQIGRVGRDHDERKEPPGARQYPGAA